MRWLWWGLTLEIYGFGLLLAAGVAGLVALLLLLPGCPVLMVFSLVALLSVFPTALGRLLCLGAPRDSGVHSWLVAGLAASALSLYLDHLFPVAVLLNVQVLVALTGWSGLYELKARGRSLQCHLVAWFVACYLLGGVSAAILPIFTWAAWLFTSYVILVMDVRSQLASSR